MKSQDVGILWEIFAFFWKNEPLRQKFQNSVPTSIAVVVFKFREIWPTGNGRNRRYLRDKKKHNFACLSNCRYSTDRAQNNSRFRRNRFTFGGVIAERVNTTKSPRKVNPKLGRSLASSRIIILMSILTLALILIIKYYLLTYLVSGF